MNRQSSQVHQFIGEVIMVNSRITRLAAMAIASTMVVGTIGSASAAPVLSSTVAVKAAQEGPITNVRWGWGWRGGGWHGGWGPGPVVAGLAAGALVAGAAAGSYYAPGYYAPYAYGPYAYGGYYAPRYYYAPGYYRYSGPYAPGYSGYGPCFTDEGYGRASPC